MGTCELFLPPEEISLKPHFTLQDDSTRIVVGALLERQLQSLEPSRYKPAVKNTISVLLKDALDVYSSGGNLPLRRSGICLKWLEGTYFGSADSASDGADIKSMGDEVQKLLSREVMSYHVLCLYTFDLCADRISPWTRPLYISEHNIKSCFIYGSPSISIVLGTLQTIPTLRNTLKKPARSSKPCSIPFHIKGSVHLWSLNQRWCLRSRSLRLQRGPWEGQLRK